MTFDPKTATTEEIKEHVGKYLREACKHFLCDRTEEEKEREQEVYDRMLERIKTTPQWIEVTLRFDKDTGEIK